MNDESAVIIDSPLGEQTEVFDFLKSKDWESIEIWQKDGGKIAELSSHDVGTLKEYVIKAFPKQ